MCTVTQHAMKRCKERWKSTSDKEAEREILESYHRSVKVGEWMEPGKLNPMKLMLDKQDKRLMVVATDRESVITVFDAQHTPLALDMYDDVISLHKRRIGALERKFKSIARRRKVEYTRLHTACEQLDGDIAQMESRLANLKLQRDHINATLDNYTNDMSKVAEQKKAAVRSLANYLTM